MGVVLLVVAALNRLEQLSEEQLAEFVAALAWFEALVWIRLTRLAVEGNYDSQEP